MMCDRSEHNKKVVVILGKDMELKISSYMYGECECMYVFGYEKIYHYYYIASAEH